MPIVLLVIAALMFMPDAADPGDSNIVISNPYSSSIGENSYPLLLSTLDSVELLEATPDLTRPDNHDCNLLDEHISKYKDTYAQIEAASGYGSYIHVPLAEQLDYEEYKAPNLSSLIFLFRLKLKTVSCEEPMVNKCDSECMLKYYRLGHLMMSGTGSIVEFAFGLKIKEEATRSILSSSPDSIFSNGSSSAVNLFSSKETDIYKGLRNSIAVEYFIGISGLKSQSEYSDYEIYFGMGPGELVETLYYKALLGLFYQEKRMRQITAESFNSFYNPVGSQPLSKIKIKDINLSWMEELLQGNISGYFVVTDVGYDPSQLFAPMIDRVYLSDFIDKAIALKIAVLSFEQQHGALPESLDELVPDFIAAVPADPFDGAPVRYDKQKEIIYSPGFDFYDHGGLSDIRLEQDSPWGKQKYQRDIVLGVH